MPKGRGSRQRGRKRHGGRRWIADTWFPDLPDDDPRRWLMDRVPENVARKRWGKVKARALSE